MPQRYIKPHDSVLPPKSMTPLPLPDSSTAIALLQQWAREDATDDPAVIAQAERELAEFKAALNVNHPPDKPVFS